MKKIRIYWGRIFFAIVFFIFAFLLYLFVCFSASTGNNLVCINSHCFDVRIADNSAERADGLMFQKNLELNKGMIFIFEKDGLYKFWMKNTLIPLDMIWINQNKTIVHISENNLPCVDACVIIDPQKQARYVLEINAGLSEKYLFREGMKVEFQNIKL